jgi:hypothetical protein
MGHGMSFREYRYADAEHLDVETVSAGPVD